MSFLVILGIIMVINILMAELAKNIFYRKINS
jgi:hypothetical protein